MKRLKLAPDVRSVTDEDGAVLLNLKNGRYYSVNRVGALICNALAEGARPTEIVSNLVRTYKTNAETIHRDVETFLAALNSKQMLIVDDDG